MYKTILFIMTSIFFQSTYADVANYATSYSKVELSTPAGVYALHQRLVKAGQDYCPGYLQMKSHSAVEACVEGVVKDLVSKIDHPALTTFASKPYNLRKAPEQLIAAKDK